jgi:signal transduction histidine kinase
LKQIITNLVGNAVKVRAAASGQGTDFTTPIVLTPVELPCSSTQFTSQGQVALTARLVDVEDGVAEVVFCVADTGIGIKPDKLDLIFDTFAQADGSTTRVSTRKVFSAACCAC